MLSSDMTAAKPTRSPRKKSRPAARRPAAPKPGPGVVPDGFYKAMVWNLRNGVVAITAAISPYAAVRREVRAGCQAAFVEVYVEAPLEVVEERDTKGLYKKARAGIIKNFTGISDPYEAPHKPDVLLRTGEESIEASAGKILAHLAKQGLIKA